MSEDRFDIAVVGAGPVGLVAALGFAQAGFATCLVGPEPERRDGRTAALLAPAVEFLSSLGLWPDLALRAGALRVLRIVDESGTLFRPPPATFRAAEIGLDAFGWNIENAELAGVLGGAARRQTRLTWRRDLVEDLEVNEVAQLCLADRSRISASLVVAADGRRSRLREAAGIAARERSYRQSAFTAIFRHEREHGDASTEFHTRSGPFTLVPLPGRRSSLVWVTVPPHADRLLAASDADLALAVDEASRSILGRMEVDGPRGAVPLASMSAESWTAPRLALAGEAAHVLPPIGAQGLNLGLADVGTLVGIARQARGVGADPGSPPILARYERERRTDVRLRSLAVDGLNRSLLAALPPLDAARGLALGLIGGVAPLRRAVMRAGVTGSLRGRGLPEARVAPDRPR